MWWDSVDLQLDWSVHNIKYRVNKVAFLDIWNHWKENHRDYPLIETDTWKELFFYEWIDESVEWNLWEYDWKDKDLDSTNMFIAIFISIDWFK